MAFQLVDGKFLLVDGKFAIHEDCCCGGSPCNNGDPSINLTVTGDSGTITWCGETWNLPSDSGLTIPVCPTSYYKKKAYVPSTGGNCPIWYGVERWAISSVNGLDLWREYAMYKKCTTNQYTALLGAGGHYFQNRLWLIPADLYESLDQVIGFVVGAPGPRPIAPTYTYIQYNGQGKITAVPLATYSGYRITDEYFGTYTNSAGIQFTWSRGQGW
jgi:hypothetical protein